MSSSVAHGRVAPIALSPARRREHRFYTGMALAIALVVVLGFSRTYYLRPYFTPTPLAPFLHLHGIVFTAWILLFVAQTSLVAAHRVDLHRRLGVAAVALAALLVVVGTTTAIRTAQIGAPRPDGLPATAFLITPLVAMVTFTGLLAAALYYRRRPDLHKRLMLLATISILGAPIARLPGVRPYGPPLVFALADIFIVACVAYDVVSRGRIHRATAWGGLIVIAAQPLRLVVGRTEAWHSVAVWLTGGR